MDAVGEWGGLRLDDAKPISELRNGYTYFRDGDTVVAKVTPCFENGKGALAVGLVGGIAFGTTELQVLRPGARLDSRFLFYLTLSHAFRATGASEMYGAGGQKRVPEWFCRDFMAPVPPLSTQRLLAAFLDRKTAAIDQLIQKKERLIELLQEKRQALIDRLLEPDHGPFVKLGHFADLLPGYAFPSDGFNHDGGVRLLRGVNVSTGTLRWGESVYWPTNHVAALSRFRLRAGDVVLGMDRPRVSSGIRAAVVTESDCPGLLLQRVARLRARTGLAQEYILLLVSSPKFHAYFEPIMTGVSVPHISPDQILGFRFRLPRIGAQQQACESFRTETLKTEKLQSQLETHVALLGEYRQALISAAVTGHIGVSFGEPFRG